MNYARLVAAGAVTVMPGRRRFGAIAVVTVLFGTTLLLWWWWS